MSDFFNNTLYLDSVDSTNNYLKKGDFEDKTIVYTFNQTKGRGRMQKEWNDFKDKNLAVSFLFKQGNFFHNNLWYIAAASLAIVDILDKYNVKDRWIKWPNDVYISDKKLVGILAESIWKNGAVERVVVGVGINVNCDETDLKSLDNKATSIFLETGVFFDPDNFIFLFKSELSKWLSILETSEGINTIREKWATECQIINKQVRWDNGKEIIEGKVVDIELDGGLILQKEDETIKIISGEVKVI